MQAVCVASSVKPAVQQRRAGARASRAAVPVTCNVEQAKKAVAAAVATLPLVAAPAMALVDERLNGDGVGYAFGISSGGEAFAIFGIFGLIWAVYATTAKTLGGASNDDSGMSL